MRMMMNQIFAQVAEHPLFAVIQAQHDLEESTAIDVVQTSAALLLLATLIGMVVRRMRIPYAVALVLGGMLVYAGHFESAPDLDPEILLFVFLPPLLFDSAFRLEAEKARSLLKPVLLLAVVGVVITTVLVGVTVHLALAIPVASALLFGAIIAATDPVAVLSIFKQLHVPNRLSFIAEAESLVNDGMAITLYVVLMEWAVTGAFSLTDSLSTFVLEVGGGVLIGFALGFLASRVTRHVDDHLIEMCLSVSLAYGSYLIADYFGASGPLACVFAGVVHGSYGRRIGMSDRTRLLLDDLWEFLGFIANAFVFILLGLSIHVRELADAWTSILVAVFAVVLSRWFITYSTSRATLRNPTPGQNRREAIVLTWGGMRGALTAALALALPASIPYRNEVVQMAFGIVLFTLVVQGSTLGYVIERLKFAQPE